MKNKSLINLLNYGDTGCSCNRMYFLYLLDNELHSCKKIYDDVSVCCYAIENKIKCEYFEVSSLRDLREKLKRIEIESKKYKPLIHIEAHGQEKSGIIISKTAELMSFKELITWFRKININCRNNLQVVLPVCYGYDLYYDLIKLPCVTEAVPFYYIISSEKEINGIEVELLTKYYKDLIINSDILKSIKKLREKTKTLVMNISEILFLSIFESYYLNYKSNKVRQERVEHFITQARLDNKLNKEKLTETRNEYKKKVKDFSSAFTRYKNSFLLADKPGNENRFTYTFEDFLNALNENE